MSGWQPNCVCFLFTAAKIVSLFWKTSFPSGWHKHWPFSLASVWFLEESQFRGAQCCHGLIVQVSGTSSFQNNCQLAWQKYWWNPFWCEVISRLRSGFDRISYHVVQTLFSGFKTIRDKVRHCTWVVIIQLCKNRSSLSRNVSIVLRQVWLEVTMI